MFHFLPLRNVISKASIQSDWLSITITYSGMVYLYSVSKVTNLVRIVSPTPFQECYIYTEYPV